MSSKVLVESWAARAAVCELLALSLRYPTAELAEAVSSGEWADAAEEIAAALELALPESFSEDARAHVGEPAEILSRSLGAEATYLFIGVPDPAASPFEGVWRAEDDGVDPLLFVNPHSMAVERFCRSCGLGQPDGVNEPLDHVATELELLQYLASLEAGLASPAVGGPSLEDLPGGSAAAAYEMFLAEHVLAWVPRFASRVSEATRLPYYRAVADLLAAFLR